MFFVHYLLKKKLYIAPYIQTVKILVLEQNLKKIDLMLETYLKMQIMLPEKKPKFAKNSLTSY